MSVDLINLYITELPKITSEERQMRFMDVLMTNENVKDAARQKYIRDLQKQPQEIQKPSKDKKSAEMRRLQLNMMGIGLKEV